MNWAMPCAPLGLTACGLKRLSFQISRTNGMGGSPLASAWCCMIGQTISTKGLGPASARPAAVAPASTRASSPSSGPAGNARRKSPIARLGCPHDPHHAANFGFFTPSSESQKSSGKFRSRLPISEANSSARCRPRHPLCSLAHRASASSRLSMPIRAEYCKLVPRWRSQLSTTVGS